MSFPSLCMGSGLRDPEARVVLPGCLLHLQAGWEYLGKGEGE